MRLLSLAILGAYSALLVKVMVFKDVPMIRVGQLMLNFGGIESGQAANLVPFATIMPYLFGYKGWLIAGINLAGNIVLLIPIGFLVPLVFQNITWKRALALAASSGLIIELLQTVLRVGIFDIDDVILNALGVMIGFIVYVVLTAWIRERKYLTILVTMLIGCAAVAGVLYTLYPHNEPVLRPADSTSEQSDLCGGTGGIGQIIRVAPDFFTLVRKDGTEQHITLTPEATITTPTGPATVADLKQGDRVTLVGDGQADGSFVAHTVLVCNAPSR